MSYLRRERFSPRMLKASFRELGTIILECIQVWLV